MKCPHCKSSMKQKNKPREVKGFKHGMPGIVLSYWCAHCEENVKFFTIHEPLYFKKREERAKHVREDAEIAMNARIKLYEFERDLHTGNIRRQAETLQRVLASFTKKLP